MGCCPCLDIPHADHSFSNTIYSSSRKHELNPEQILKTSNWMQRVSDDTYVSDLSIPGTHNSATYASKFYQVRRLGQCQVMSIYEQLQAGIRFMDIRVTPVKDQIYLCHGPIKYAPLSMALSAIAMFITLHPSEFILLAFHGQGGKIEGYHEKLLKQMQENDVKYVLTKEILKVKQLRGKVWILSGYTVNFPDTFLLIGRKGINKEARLYFQNHYEQTQTFTIAQKSNKVLETAFQVQTTNPKTKQPWLKVNFLSFSGLDHWTTFFKGPYPYQYAFDPHGANATLYQHLQKQTKKVLGVTVMDFPGQQLIQRILKCNNFVSD